MKRRPSMSYTVRGQIFTPDKFFILMVHERTEVLKDEDGLPRLEANGRSIIKPEGWGLVGGGHRQDDHHGFWREIINQIYGPNLDDQRAGWLATLFRELCEETGVRFDEVCINPSVAIFEKKGGDYYNHQTIVFDGEYQADYNAINLCPTDSKIIEARWTSITDAVYGKIDGHKIYMGHLGIIRHETKPDHIIS